MKIGCAKEVITPAFPIFLAGFAAKREAVEAHDDLYVKTVVLQTFDGYYGVISYDLLGVDCLLMDGLSEEMERIGLNISHFIVTATHTHSGPCGIMETSKGLAKGMECVVGKKDPALIAGIVSKTIRALKAAVQDCQETRIRTAEGSLSGIGKNRNNKDLKGDEDIFVVELIQENGNRALLVNFACHPTALGFENIRVSADFPGAVDRMMSGEGYCFTMYLNGCCGDISTRFTRQGKGFPEAERYGKLMADKLKELLESPKEAELKKIKAESFEAELKLKTPDDPMKAKEELDLWQCRVDQAKEKGVGGSELRLIESRRDGALMSFQYAQNAVEAASWPVELQVLQVNKELFIGIPGELFSELSNGLKQKHVHFVGYTGGCLGYFADMAAYDCFNYEALSSPFERGQAEALVERIGEYIRLNLAQGEA